MHNSRPEVLPADHVVDYRTRVSLKNRFSWIVKYRFSDIFISSDKDIHDKIASSITSFYKDIDKVIESDKPFARSLRPLKAKKYYPEIIKKMCHASSIFDVGPMASVAGAVCEYLAKDLAGYYDELIIENGGDTLMITDKDPSIGLYVKNKYFDDSIGLKVTSKEKKVSVCSSSSTFGHSYSEGKCDLAAAFSSSAIYADSAATSIANKTKEIKDIKKNIKYFSGFEGISGIVIIKENKIGIWGDVELLR